MHKNYFSLSFNLFFIIHRQISEGITIIAVNIKKIPQSPFSQSTNAPDDESHVTHCNSHSSFKDKVSMSNLCQEITLPTTPIQDIHDEQGEIALCILSAVNVGGLNDLSELENICDLSVRALEQIIDYQDYPVKAAEVSTKKRRRLGVFQKEFIINKPNKIIPQVSLFIMNYYLFLKSI